MAFFDKLTAAANAAKNAAASAAKTAGEKANTTIEIGKLNMKIKAENTSIEEFKTQIGDLLWAQYQEGTVTDPQVVALCESIGVANANILELQAKIDELKAHAESEAAPETAAPIERHCTKCGAVVADDARFCNSCGARLDESFAEKVEEAAEELKEKAEEIKEQF